MLADRTLLGITLVATFAAGGLSGWAARDRRGETPYRPTQAEYVYADRLAELRRRGYDDDEMREAVRLHQKYLDAYQRWWAAFLDAQADNFDEVDGSFERELADLETRFLKRRDGGSPR